MSYDAFDHVPLFHLPVDVTAVCADGMAGGILQPPTADLVVYVGTAKGLLAEYSVEFSVGKGSSKGAGMVTPPASPGPGGEGKEDALGALRGEGDGQVEATATATLRRTRKGLAEGRAVQGLATVRGAGLLVALVDSTIHVYDLASLALLSSFKRSKGTTSFVVQQPVLLQGPEGAPQKKSRARVFAAMGKAVSVFELNDAGEWELVKTVPTLSRIRAMSISTPSLSRPQTLHLLLTPSTSATFSLFPTFSSRTPEARIEVASVDVSNGVDSTVSVAALGRRDFVGEEGGDAPGEGKFFSLDEAGIGGMAVTWDVLTALAPSSSPASISSRLRHSLPPSSIALHPPYAIAAHTTTQTSPSTLAIHHIPSSRPVQSIPLAAPPPSAALPQPPPTFAFSASMTRSVSSVSGRPLSEVSSSFALPVHPNSGIYGHSRRPSGASTAAGLAASARSRAGSTASVTGRATPSLSGTAVSTASAGDSAATIGVVVSEGRVWTWCGGTVGVAVDVGWKERVRRLLAKEDYESAVGYVKEGEGVPEDVRTSLPPSLTLLHARSLLHIDPTRAFSLLTPLDPDPRNICALFPRLPRWTWPQTDDDDPPPQSYDSLVRWLTERRMHVGAARQRARDDPVLEERARVVDTCLLAAYLACKPSLVRPLLRVDNRVDQGAAERWLGDRERVEALWGRGNHAEAIEFLRSRADTAEKIARDGGDGDEGVDKGLKEMAGPGPTIAYLRRLTEADLELVVKGSTWALEQAPEEALEIFTDPPYTPSPATRRRVLRHLSTVSSDLALAYLEHLAYDLHDTSADLHEHLASLYLSESQDDATEDSEDVDSSRRRLREFLAWSTAYDPDAVLALFPRAGLYDERAVLLSKLGRHEEALDVFVNRLGDKGMAESYAVSHYRPKGTARDVFAVLVKLHLAREGGVEDALKLLGKYGDRVDPEKIPALLPSTVKIGRMTDYFSKSFHELVRARRDGQVVRNLAGTERAQVQELLLTLQRRRVQVTRERSCARCLKRVGTSAFVLSGGDMYHYACLVGSVAGVGGMVGARR